MAQFKTTASLRIWLSVLAENRVKSNEGEVLIIGFVINQYKKGLIDPLDKTPSLEKTIFRVLELLRKFFSVNQNLLRMTPCLSKWPAKKHGWRSTKAALRESPLRPRRGWATTPWKRSSTVEQTNSPR